MRFLTQTIAVALAGAALGLGVNGFSAHPARLVDPVYPTTASGGGTCSAEPPKGHRMVSQVEAASACTACSAGFVDARGAAAFAQGHIPGAHHLPPAGHPQESSVLADLRKFATVVVYDAGEACGLAKGVADRLVAEGFKDVRILEGNWTAWQASGEPAQSGVCQVCEGHDHR